MLAFTMLSSGSSGNAAVLRSDNAVILIDCGCTAKYVCENLAVLGLKPQDISAAVVTHAHGDHISDSGLSLLIKNKIKIYSHSSVFDDIYAKFGEKINDCATISVNGDFKVGDIEITCFGVHHKDARVSKTIGFYFVSKVDGRKYKIGYVTDTGKICADIAENLKNSNILAIESNYDRQMLEASSRPYENKQWILSDKGHLSNEEAAAALLRIKNASTAKDSLKYVFLSHISGHHNTSRTALKISQDALNEHKIKDVRLLSAERLVRSATVKIA